ncbi:hypothetical protein AGMMS49991_02150 [Spirochaetia bacterium]|nr:hypothetical protein AGMMS49991_02150 [Spirochaetia bacterium]
MGAAFSRVKAVAPVLGMLIILWEISACSGAPVVTVAPMKLVPPPPEAVVEPTQEITGTQGILMRMSARLDKNDYTGAIALFDEIDAEEAASAPIRLLKASVMISGGQTSAARTLVNEILKGDSENSEALFVLASIEKADKQESKQKQTLERLIKTNPTHTGALIGLGDIALRGRSFRTAAGYYDRVLATEPQNRSALTGRADVYRRNRDPEKAEALLNQVISLYPQWPVGWSERARLYRGKNALAQALSDMDTAKKLAPNDYWVSYDRGHILVDMNRKQEALEEFNRAISLNQNYFLAYVYTAGIKEEFGDLDGAAQDYATIVRLNPEYYFAFEGLGFHRMRQKRWAEARDAFREAYRQAPTETAYVLLAAANWMRTLPASAQRVGIPADLKAFLEAAMRHIPQDSLERYVVRLYAERNGDADVAGRIDREKNPATKARMSYYLALYYDREGSKTLADRYFLSVKAQDQKGIPEWRLNEWAITERSLALNAPAR